MADEVSKGAKSDQKQPKIVENINIAFESQP